MVMWNDIYIYIYIYYYPILKQKIFLMWKLIWSLISDSGQEAELQNSHGFDAS